MPVGCPAPGQQSHGERRGVDDADAFAFEIVQVVRQFVVVQCVVAEVEHAFHRAFRHVVDDPLQVFQLQVGDAHVSHDAFFPQLHQCREGFVGHLRQVGKFYVVHVDEVDVVHMQAFHALIHAFLRLFCGIIPRVYPVFSVTSHFRGQDERAARQVFQHLAQHGFGFVMPVIGRHVDEVHPVFHCGQRSPHAVRFTDGMENASQRGCPET